MLWWKKLRKSTKEEDQAFAQRLEDEKVTWKERLLMTLTAYVVIFIPAVLVLLAFAFFILWMFRAF